ncbi:MAG: amidohydrolase family protein [Candidatus Bathyarchaeia archaeon]
MEDLAFFDCNCMVGRWSTLQPGSFYSVEGLLEEMSYCGIGEALVFHSLARSYSPAFGNERLLEEIRGKNQLHGCWVLLPHHTGEVPEPETMVESMLSKGVKAARLFPKEHRYSLSEWVLGGLLPVLEEHRIPLLLDFGNVHWSDSFTDWNAVAELCSKHPKLPVILMREGLAASRNLYPLLERFENLHLDTSYYFVHRGVEEICEKFGAKHLVFGSGMPTYSAGPPMMVITYSSISQREKGLIAGENLRRLLGGVR